MLIYAQAFDEMKFGYAIAESIVVSVAIIAVSVLQIHSTNRKKVYEWPENELERLACIPH